MAGLGKVHLVPSNQGSSVSATRLNGANLSRAMRSQVSSTEAKVSRE